MTRLNRSDRDPSHGDSASDAAPVGDGVPSGVGDPASGGGGGPGPGGDAAGSTRAATGPVPGDRRDRARSRRLMAEVFGDVLPETGGRDVTHDAAGDDHRERWYRENRPPHHGG